MIKTKRRVIELKINFPTIVCLCGSGRFRQAFDDAECAQTLAGNIVLTIGCNTKDIARDVDFEHHKPALDELHKRKIDLADEVFVLNVEGYIGASTRSEIEYAEAHGKPVRYLESHENAVSVNSVQISGHSEESAEDRIKYERDMLLMLILDEDEFGEGAFDRAVEKLRRAT